MDLGTIQYNVEANTTDIDRANASVDNMAEHMDKAGTSTDNLGKKMGAAGKESGEFVKKNDKAADSMKNSGNMAKQMGYQLQDAVVQLQGGANASLVFSQQGSQLLSVIHPLLGLAAALAGVIAGAVIPSLLNAGDAVQTVSDLTKELTKDFKDFSDAQKLVIGKGVALSLAEQKKALEANQDAIRAQSQALADYKKQYDRAFNENAPSFEKSNARLEDKAKLVQLGLEQVKIEQSIKALEDPTGSSKKIKSLTDEVALIDLKGEALYREKAAQQGLTGEAEKQYISLNLLKEQKLASIQAGKDSDKEIKKSSEESARLLKQSEREREAAAKKREEDERRRKESINSMTMALQREADMFDVSSKYLQTEYDIKTGLIKVNGGLAGSEAQLLLVKAKRLDQMAEERDLAESLDAEGDRARKKTEEETKEAAKFSEDAAERINSAFAGAWVGLLDGSMDVFDGIKKAFFQTIAEMAHEAITKPIILNIQQSLTGGGTSLAQGAGIGKAGMYAAAAAVTVALVGLWNKKQDEKFLKLTAEYKQANQGLSAILGEGNKHSQSIAKSIEHLDSVNGNVLDVNYQMLFTLQDIRTGIGQTAAGFAKNIANGAPAPATGSMTANPYLGAAIIGGGIGLGIKVIGDAIGGDIGGFINGVIDKISSALYGKSKKLIDSGIQVFGSSLKDIIDGATIQAKSYSDIKSTTKVLGIKTSTSLSRTTNDLSDVFEQQFSDVFESAGDALKQASKAFGINFDDFADQLKIKAQDISLKDLTGDELTKAIEGFFSSTMDTWANIILSGGEQVTSALTAQEAVVDKVKNAFGNGDAIGMFRALLDAKSSGAVTTLQKIPQVLLDFQQVGEGAFDTMIRLASETNTFTDYVQKLGLNMHATGLAAVYAAQNVAEISGGFDALSSSLAVYYDKFFSLDDKIKQAGESIQDYFGDLGLSVPKTRDEFKSLISALDLTDDAQAKQFAALIKVSGALDQYIDALDDQAEAAKAAQEELKRQKIELAQNAYSGLGRAVDAQKKIIDKQIASMNEALSVSKSVYAALGSALDGMVISSKKTQEATRKQAQGQLSDMLGAAKGGKLPNIDDLNNALSVISQPSESLYGSFQEYAADFYATANTIKDLQDIAGAQVSTDEKSLAELEKQSTALDDLLVWGKAQLDVLSGIDISVLSVADALRSFASAVGVESPATQNKRFIDMAAGSSLETVTPQQQTAIDEAKQQAMQREKQDQDFKEFMRASQLAVADNTDKIKKILDKFDTVGMPPERVV